MLGTTAYNRHLLTRENFGHGPVAAACMRTPATAGGLTELKTTSFYTNLALFLNGEREN